VYGPDAFCAAAARFERALSGCVRHRRQSLDEGSLLSAPIGSTALPCGGMGGSRPRLPRSPLRSRSSRLRR